LAFKFILGVCVDIENWEVLSSDKLCFYSSSATCESGLWLVVASLFSHSPRSWPRLELLKVNLDQTQLYKIGLHHEVYIHLYTIIWSYL